MRFGGWPAQRVWMTTSTSEMSGNASMGICIIDQMPAAIARIVPVKTRKRFAAHQRRIRAIIYRLPVASTES